MKHANTPQLFRVTGNVVEIFQKAGKPVTRISINPYYLDLPSEYLQDAHLQDAMIIEGHLTIETVQNDFTENLTHPELNED